MGSPVGDEAEETLPVGLGDPFGEEEELGQFGARPSRAIPTGLHAMHPNPPEPVSTGEHPQLPRRVTARDERRGEGRAHGVAHLCRLDAEAAISVECTIGAPQ